MRPRSILLAGTVALLGAPLIGCAGKVIVTPVPASVAAGDKQKLDGVIFALPRTVVKVTVPVVRTAPAPGIYVKYLDLFFPDAHEKGEYVRATERVAFSIAKPVVGTFGEPDPTKMYYVKLTGGLLVDRTASLDFTEQGTVSGVSAGTEDYTIELAVAALGAASGIIARRPTFGPQVKVAAAKTLARCTNQGPWEDTIVHRFFLDRGTEELFVNYCHLDAKQQPNILAAVKAANDGSNDSLSTAVSAYVHIRYLVGKRWEFITQSPVDTPLPSLSVMLSEIDAQVAREMATFFTGQRTRMTWAPIFEVRPKTVNDQPAELLRFDEASGVCSFARLHAQEDPSSVFTSPQPCNPLTATQLRVRFALDGDSQMFQRVDSVYKLTGDRSFRYVIPAATLAIVELVGPRKSQSDTAEVTTKAVAAIVMGQFGAEVSLPASSGGRSLNYSLKFFEATGALKSFTLASKAAAQAAAVNSASSSTNAILDAKNKQAQAAKTAADTLTKLERQRQILEEEAKIKALCTQLGVIF